MFLKGTLCYFWLLMKLIIIVIVPPPVAKFYDFIIKLKKVHIKRCEHFSPFAIIVDLC